MHCCCLVMNSRFSFAWICCMKHWITKTKSNVSTLNLCQTWCWLHICPFKDRLIFEDSSCLQSRFVLRISAVHGCGTPAVQWLLSSHDAAVFSVKQRFAVSHLDPQWNILSPILVFSLYIHVHRKKACSPAKLAPFCSLAPLASELAGSPWKRKVFLLSSVHSHDTKYSRIQTPGNANYQAYFCAPFSILTNILEAQLPLKFEVYLVRLCCAVHDHRTKDLRVEFLRRAHYHRLQHRGLFIHTTRSGDHIPRKLDANFYMLRKFQISSDANCTMILHSCTLGLKFQWKFIKTWPTQRFSVDYCCHLASKVKKKVKHQGFFNQKADFGNEEYILYPPSRANQLDRSISWDGSLTCSFVRINSQVKAHLILHHKVRIEKCTTFTQNTH